MLCGILENDYYNHFLVFHAAVFILCNEKLYLIYNEYADQLLHYFVKVFPDLYGPEQV